MKRRKSTMGAVWLVISGFILLPASQSAADPKIDQRLERYINSCRQGQAGACFSLGQWELAAAHPEQASEYFKMSCDLGSAPGCASLSEARRKTERGRSHAAAGEEKHGNVAAGKAAQMAGDRDAARKHFDRACRQGDPEGCTLLYYTMDSGPERTDLTSRLAGDCLKGEIFACNALASIANLADDLLTTGRWLRLACLANGHSSCRDIGLLEKDFGSASLARAWLAIACGGDQSVACFNRADLEMEQGDINEAMTWYLEACIRGLALGCTKYRDLDQRGDVPLRDDPRPFGAR